jgi:hypothetical protein
MSRLCRKEGLGQFVGLQQEGPGRLSVGPSERSGGSLAGRGQVICPRLYKQKSLNGGLVSKRCGSRLPTCPPHRFCCGELPVGKQTSQPRPPGRWTKARAFAQGTQLPIELYLGPESVFSGLCGSTLCGRQLTGSRQRPLVVGRRTFVYLVSHRTVVAAKRPAAAVPGTYAICATVPPLMVLQA